MKRMLPDYESCGGAFPDYNREAIYQSDDLDEIERQYKQNTARAMSILARRKEIRRRLKAAGRKV